jgi:hypothetical protein
VLPSGQTGIRSPAPLSPRRDPLTSCIREIRLHCKTRSELVSSASGRGWVMRTGHGVSGFHVSRSRAAA